MTYGTRGGKNAKIIKEQQSEIEKLKKEVEDHKKGFWGKQASKYLSRAKEAEEQVRQLEYDSQEQKDLLKGMSEAIHSGNSVDFSRSNLAIKEYLNKAPENETPANVRLAQAAPKLLQGLIDLRSQLIDRGVQTKDSVIINTIDAITEPLIKK